MSESTRKQTTGPSDSSNFTQIFDTAVDEYKKLTKEDLRTHPFATAFGVCNTPDTILDVFRGQAQAFHGFREGDEKLMKWLDPTVHLLFTLSATLGEGIDLVSLSFPLFISEVRSNTCLLAILSRKDDIHGYWGSSRSVSLPSCLNVRLP
jgi:hypothetical protein